MRATLPRTLSRACGLRYCNQSEVALFVKMGVITSLLSLLLLVSVAIEARSLLSSPDYLDYELDDHMNISTINSTSTKNLSLVSHSHTQLASAVLICSPSLPPFPGLCVWTSAMLHYSEWAVCVLCLFSDAFVWNLHYTNHCTLCFSSLSV